MTCKKGIPLICWVFLVVCALIRGGVSATERLGKGQKSVSLCRRWRNYCKLVSLPGARHPFLVHPFSEVRKTGGGPRVCCCPNR